MQNARVTDFVVFELLKENQHRWGGGVKLLPTPLLRHQG